MNGSENEEKICSVIVARVNITIYYTKSDEYSNTSWINIELSISFILNVLLDAGCVTGLTGDTRKIFVSNIIFKYSRPSTSLTRRAS